MGSRSVRKGKAWERECAVLLTDATGMAFERVLTEPRDGNVGDVDADGSPLVVQCRVGARPNPYQALRDAAEAAKGTDRLPVGLVKKNGRGSTLPETLAVVRLGDFLDLIERLHGPEGKEA